MPWTIIFGVVRAVAPTVLPAIALAYPQYNGPITWLLSVIVGGGAVGFSIAKNTDSAQIANVEAMGAKIVVPRNATGALAEAAADPNRPLVVTQ